MDIEHPAQDAASWFKGENKLLERLSLQPEGMTECKCCSSLHMIYFIKPGCIVIVSVAPPPASQAQSKSKFELGKKYVSEEQRRQEQMAGMFQQAKSIEGDDVKPKSVNPEDEEVAEDEWDD